MCRLIQIMSTVVAPSYKGRVILKLLGYYIISQGCADENYGGGMRIGCLSCCITTWPQSPTLYMCVCTWVCVYVCMHVGPYIHTYVLMYACMYTHRTHITQHYIHTYTHHTTLYTHHTYTHQGWDQL